MRSSRSYKVHEFAELAGVTVKALHHYDRLGLLTPRRTEAGYRVYTERDLERLEQIVALKFLGLPLRQIKRGPFDARNVQFFRYDNVSTRDRVTRRSYGEALRGEPSLIPPKAEGNYSSTMIIDGERPHYAR
jgi:hypothetical protein